MADAYTKTHDLKSSEQIKNVGTDARAISSLYVNDVYISPQFDRAVALDDWPAALSASQSQLDALASNPEGSELASYARARFVLPNMAFALAQSGRLAEAQKIAAASPKDCYLCERTTAWVVGLGGDMVQAARDYSDAINQNPSLPFADFEWGKLLLLKGDLSGAAAHFERSAKLGPRFADPLKIWGDVLLVQGKSREALSNYALAADRAPRWGGLHLNWSKALWASGEKGDAQRKLAAAARMDLAASENSSCYDSRCSKSSRVTLPFPDGGEDTIRVFIPVKACYNKNPD